MNVFLDELKYSLPEHDYDLINLYDDTYQLIVDGIPTDFFTNGMFDVEELNELVYMASKEIKKIFKK